MTPLEKLQVWFQNQCDGDWEHGYGIQIETLDNPGWAITINLEGTSAFFNREFDVKEDKSESDWYIIKVEGDTFTGFGDPNKLSFLINYFLTESEKINP